MTGSVPAPGSALNIHDACGIKPEADSPDDIPLTASTAAIEKASDTAAEISGCLTMKVRNIIPLKTASSKSTNLSCVATTQSCGKLLRSTQSSMRTIPRAATVRRNATI